VASRSLPSFALLLVGLLGCSGSDDVGGEPQTDSTVDDTTSDTLDATAADTSKPVDSGIDSGGGDTSADVVIDSTTDAGTDDTADGADAALDSDDTLDATIDIAIDTGPETPPADTAPDISYDATFTPPSWSPVCVPVYVPPPDAGPDAADADAASDSVSDSASDSVSDSDSASDSDSDPDSASDSADTAPPPDTLDASDAVSDADAPVCTATRLRIVTSNLTSGSTPTYASPGIDILQGLHPDIALMQEFKYPSGLRALVDTAFGPTFNYVTETDVGAIPNGIVSRYPIIEGGEWDDPYVTDRDFVWARIDVPGAIDLYAVSVHLLTSSSTARDSEAKSLIGYIKAKVPAGAYLVIGGDCNTSIVTEPVLIDFSEIVDVSPPYAADQAGNSNTNAPRSKPYDWVLPSLLLRARLIPVTIGTASFPAGLVFDSRVYTPLSDVPPVLSSDSAATNMQHMAVVRDFALGD
jgi:endonuclease/exonuclease/phosphatase family metal-dependent hydrolase